MHGQKRAGTGLLWAYEADGELLPASGDLEVVVDEFDEPVVLTRITAVEVVRFDAVTARYAALEGEGDRSLEHWRAAHWEFFSGECRRIGRTPSLDMPVVCQSFTVLQRIDGP
ncbi:MAG: ASCH domain-containing protein [Pseudomonadota bacterium]|nr:ASCH domain-containing protein [Pseudomonadota bacterium]